MMNPIAKLVRWPMWRAVPEIKIEPSSYKVLDNGKVKAEVPWDSITKVVARRHDAMTYDVVSLEISAGAPVKVWQVSDEMKGFWDLAKRLSKVLPGFAENWEDEVVKSAVRERQLTLFTKRPVI